MAGDWIKLEHTTPDKPEVYRMADCLKIDQDSVTGKLVRLWIWADQQSIDGNSLNITDSFIDRITACTGFSAALRSVGWLQDRSDALLSLPNFTRHNGQTAKARADTYRRVSNHRDKSSQKQEVKESCNGESVTKTLQKRYQRTEEETEIEKKEIKDMSRFTIFNKLWEAAYRKAFKIPYKHGGGKDGIGVNSLLRMDHYSMEKLIEIAEKAWSQRDERKAWKCVKMSKTIANFSNYFGDILNELGELKTDEKNDDFSSFGEIK